MTASIASELVITTPLLDHQRKYFSGLGKNGGWVHLEFFPDCNRKKNLILTFHTSLAEAASSRDEANSPAFILFS